MADIVENKSVSIVTANWMRGSLDQAGISLHAESAATASARALGCCYPSDVKEIL